MGGSLAPSVGWIPPILRLRARRPSTSLTEAMYLTQTLHGTAIYADQLGWCQGGQCSHIWSVWVNIKSGCRLVPLVRAFRRRKTQVFWDGLGDCYEQGLVKAVGVSNYGGSVELGQAGAAEGGKSKKNTISLQTAGLVPQNPRDLRVRTPPYEGPAPNYLGGSMSLSLRFLPPNY